MIEKTIHYCWFGGKPLPKLALRCIDSWEKNLEGYQIKRWDESNFDVNKIPYTREAAMAGKWAFVSDYVRFHVLFNEGGIYVDCDVEVIKPFDDILLKNTMFGGFENDTFVAPGLILGSVKGTTLFNEVLEKYSKRHFVINNKMDETTVPSFFTEILLNYGLVQNGKFQKVNDFVVYPKFYFAPIDEITMKLNISEETFTIHHYAGSWLSKRTRFKMYLFRISEKIYFLKVIKLTIFNLFGKRARK
jgi:mannosyltransferase OCH1-like enzyme